MDIQFYGANCITISNKKLRIVVDDNLADLGQKAVIKQGDIVLYTGAHSLPQAKPTILIDGPGEYEVSEVSIYGIPLRGHMDEAGKKEATAYKIIVDDTRFLVLGHVHPDLNERELEAIGTVDVLVVPVGGNGYTLDSVGALKILKDIEPKLIIPTHYDDKTLTYPVPQQTLEQALTGLSMEPKETVDKLRLKPSDLSEGLQQLVVLEKSK